MNMTVVGTGYVGLVAGACFADGGHRVICVDCDEAKIEKLRQGNIPIYEPGLAEIVARAIKADRLEFTSDLVDGVRRSRVVFLAVGTPPGENGEADLAAILTVSRDIGRAMDGYRLIAMKSTVPVGTHTQVMEGIRQETDHPFDYVSNPEFMKEGAAVEDFTKPDRVIIGATTPAAAELMREIYAPFMRRDERILVMDIASAEMSKYAANAMLATRISFMNELAGLCETTGADIEQVRRGAGSDSRIGTAFLYAGVGYGGSWFPQDVAALVSMGRQLNKPMRIAQAVQDVNESQRREFANRVIDHFGERASAMTLALWGLAFKSRTDDIRESPAITAVRMFCDCGMKIRAHDPEAMANATGVLGGDVVMVEEAYEALRGADALVIMTDWPEFRTPDFDRIASTLQRKLVFDGRNLFDPRAMAKRGIEYICIGRPVIPPC